jgi:hypothetical protein
MKVEQMMECLLAKMNANQAKADATLKEMKEELMARMEAKIDANQKKIMSKWTPT